MLALIVVTTLIIVLGAALLTAPRWCLRSLHRNRLWHLRDRLVRDILDGKLPADHPAVRQTLRRIESAITRIHELTLLRALVLSDSARVLSAQAREEHERRSRLCSTDGLEPDQAALVGRYCDDLKTLITGAVLLGSWLGIAAVAVLLPRALREVRQRTWDHRPVVEATIKVATDEATEVTSIGRRAREAAGLPLTRHAGVAGAA